MVSKLHEISPQNGLVALQILNAARNMYTGDIIIIKCIHHVSTCQNCIIFCFV
jgi:hypothetical protein